jgi:hypothetical protein
VRLLKPLLVVLLAASSASAQGIVMSMRETQGARVTNTQMQLDATHVRAEVRQGNDQMAAVFDGNAQVLRVINTGRKSYSELTQAEAQQMGQMVSGAMAAMQAELAKLPPEQRKMMEDMLKGRGGRGFPGVPNAGAAAASERTVYKRTGTSKVGQWSCTTYEGFRGAEKVSEICAAEGRDFGLTAADFQVARQLADFLRGMLPQVADQIALYGSPEEQGFSGFPVRRTTLVNGQPASVTEVTEVKREAIPASIFEVPAGFTKENMIGGLGRGAGGPNR